ncbi:MAG: Mur ligase family protein [Candidatus Omnitrophica bacterium]|nr:Mur ligase family protein [Candidatus Omnitrophota bacterium]
MKNREFFKGKKVVVVGLARSGVASGILLKELGAEVCITDIADSETLRKNKLELEAKGISQIELGRHSEDFVRGRDLMVISPGVDTGSQAVTWAKKFGIQIINEVELSFMVCPAKVIAITGTNGKTTVTTLIGKIIQAAGQNAVICGNIGNPFAAEVSRLKEGDLVSLEVSSFQLETIKTFKPYICVFLNFTPDHLDRYRDVNEYLAAKKRIYMNQDRNDYAVLNNADPVLKGLSKEIKANVRYFDAGSGLDPNQSAALEVAKILKIDKDICLEVFHNFKGIEHRMEWVLELSGVEFINDSKATNVDSTAWALNSINKPVILIAGGKDKGIDYSLVSRLVRQKVKALILLGEAKDKIKSALGNIVPCVETVSMQQAVESAFKKAHPGECVLLSPMCASFDMFQNYEERGRIFKKAVLDLAKN